MTSPSQMGVIGLGEENQTILIPGGAKSDPHPYISVKPDHVTVCCNLLVDFCKMAVHSFNNWPVWSLLGYVTFSRHELALI